MFHSKLQRKIVRKYRFTKINILWQLNIVFAKIFVSVMYFFHIITSNYYTVLFKKISLYNTIVFI